MDTNTKGDIAEISIQADLVKAGYQVLVPLRHSARYDLVVEKDGVFSRVQCKWAAVKGGAITASLRSIHHNASGRKTSKYTVDEIDFVAMYSVELNASFLVPFGEVAGQALITLRLEKAKNNQTNGIRLAEKYKLGAIV